MEHPAVHQKQVEDLLVHQSDRLTQFERIKGGILQEYEGDVSFLYWYSTLRYGELITKARVDWCKETLNRLKTIEQKSD